MIDVYISAFPFKVIDGDIFPEKRQAQIDNCKNQKVKGEKFYVWKLLELALFRSFGVHIKDAGLYQSGEKWTSELYKFSLSHSHGVAAVAVSKSEVGIDVEKVDLARFLSLPDNKCLTALEKENAKGKNDEEYAALKNALWTVKEAAFKQINGKVFRAENIETANVCYKTMRITANSEEYFLSVVGEIDQVNVFTQEGVSVQNMK